MSRLRDISKVLVANRGEIACRVFKTCKRMGIKTVGVYSEPDAKAEFVRMADEAYLIGPAASSHSYLNQDKIFDVVRRSGAQAIHPGYGFLSENFEFAKRCVKEDVVFIGPPAQAIYDMGIKSKSKELMEKAGVPVVPGYHGQEAANDLEMLKKEALKLGFPLMIKAVKGGGGKGMRIVRSAGEFMSQAQSCQAEAKESFGDGALLIERYVEAPRHIEVQVFGDSHGNCVYLWERDCSVQRRHQKVIEEAPALGLTQETRQKIGMAAVNAAKAVHYTSAGTVEFIVENQDFYFMEMNTRLQVEHPVTEAITGLDLVEWQLKVAMGRELPIKEQGKIPGPIGHAVEMRVYAEDPTRNFGTPSTGRLFRYIEPRGEGIRCDSGVREGSEISVYYDPMICKLIAHGGNREEAISRMKSALDSYVIQGVSHNIPLLRDILSEKTYLTGVTDTGYLPRVYPHGFTIPKLSSSHLETLKAVAAVLEACRSQRLNATLKTWEFIVSDKEKSTAVNVTKDSDGFSITVNDRQIKLPKWDMVQPTVTFIVDGETFTLQIHGRVYGPSWKIGFQGASYEFRLLSPYTQTLLDIMPQPKAGDTAKELLSPMPGVVRSVLVQVGDKVFKGQEVCTIEAMKMQNKLVVGADGIVGEVNVKEGDNVAEEDILIALK